MGNFVEIESRVELRSTGTGGGNAEC